VTFDGRTLSGARKMIQILRNALIVLGVITLVVIALVVAAVVERFRKDR